MNAKLRAANMALLGLAVIGALIGWLLGHDPSDLMVVFGALAGTTTALEAGLVGKRATFNIDAVQEE